MEYFDHTGITAEGTVIQPDLKRNQAYYDQEAVSASEILLRHSVHNADAGVLVATVSATAAAK